jgi:hypothetical protein
MKRNRVKSIQGWITTIAEVFAIAAASYGFYKLHSDQADIAAQLEQTTKLAIATQSQVDQTTRLADAALSQLQEFHRQSELMADQNKILQSTKLMEESRYFESLMPDFIPEGYGEGVGNVNSYANKGMSTMVYFFNRGGIAFIDSIAEGKKNTLKFSDQGNYYLDVGENLEIFLEIKSEEVKVNILELYVYMKDRNDRRYYQRLFTDKTGIFQYEKPVRLFK